MERHSSAQFRGAAATLLIVLTLFSEGLCPQNQRIIVISFAYDTSITSTSKVQFFVNCSLIILEGAFESHPCSQLNY